MTPEDLELVKGNIQSVISDTDIKRHAKVMEGVNAEEFKKSRVTKTETIEMQRALMGLVVHSCDLSNTTLPFE